MRTEERQLYARVPIWEVTLTHGNRWRQRIFSPQCLLKTEKKTASQTNNHTFITRTYFFLLKFELEIGLRNLDVNFLDVLF